MSHLKIYDVNTHYGSSHILFDVSLEVNEGEVVCLLGRNGAGKTTTLRTIMGLTQASSGSVLFDGIEIQKREPHEIARMGMGYVPDERIIFPDLTVRENLEVAIKAGSGGFGWTMDKVYDLFPKLAELENNLGGYLSGGEQQMLTVGRTLMGNPSLVLLDEPVEGVAPIIVQELGEQIRKLKDMGLTILFSEQNLRFARQISDRAYIIEKGRIKFSGTMDELHENQDVQKRYLMI